MRKVFILFANYFIFFLLEKQNSREGKKYQRKKYLPNCRNLLNSSTILMGNNFPPLSFLYHTDNFFLIFPLFLFVSFFRLSRRKKIHCWKFLITEKKNVFHVKFRLPLKVLVLVHPIKLILLFWRSFYGESLENTYKFIQIFFFALLLCYKISSSFLFRFFSVFSTHFYSLLFFEGVFFYLKR